MSKTLQTNILVCRWLCATYIKRCCIDLVKGGRKELEGVWVGAYICPTLRGCKWWYLVFDRKRLEPCPWQRHYGWHLVSFVIFISCAKFEEQSFNIYIYIYFLFSILLFWLYNLWRYYLPNLHNTKTSISLKWKKIFQKGIYHSQAFPDYAANIFHAIWISNFISLWSKISILKSLMWSQFCFMEPRPGKRRSSPKVQRPSLTIGSAT